MAYVAAADFRERTLKPWTANCLLSEADGTDAYLDLIIGQVTTQVELDLSDDFEPPTPDNDETLDVDGSGWSRTYVPRRVRSLTSVSTIADSGVVTLVAASEYRLHSSLVASGMADGSRFDYIDRFDNVWPYGDRNLRLVGKFGWSAVPTDIKRLVALRVYSLVKATSDPLTTITQRTTADAILTFGPSTEETEIVDRYNRVMPAVG